MATTKKKGSQGTVARAAKAVKSTAKSAVRKTGSAVRKDDWLITYSSPEIRQPIQGFVAALDSIDRETKNGTMDSTQMVYAKISQEQSIDRLITLAIERHAEKQQRRTSM